MLLSTQLPEYWNWGGVGEKELQDQDLYRKEDIILPAYCYYIHSLAISQAV